MSFGTLKVEKGLCRCCFNDGSYTSLSDPCLELGQQEVYASMLQKYLGIDLSPVPGALCAATYKICDECIQRLSDACHFKKQVLECEKRFQQLYGKSIIQVVTNSTFEIQVKEETDHGQDVKPEDDEGDDEGDDDYGSSFQYDEIEDDDDDFEMNLDLQELKQAKKIKIEKVATVKSKPKLRPSKPAVKLTVKPTAKPTVKPTAKPAVKPTVKSKKDGDSGKKEPIVKPGDDLSGYMSEETMENGMKRYRCKQCGHTVNSFSYLRKHINTQHWDTTQTYPYACKYCKRKFKLKGTFDKHLLNKHVKGVVTVDRPKVLQSNICEICQKEFATRRQIVSHFNFVHKLYSCSECPLEFTKKELPHHRNEVHGAPIPTCGICGYKNYRESKIIVHQRKVHMKEKYFPCPECDMQFFGQYQLKMHMVKHNPVKKFVCRICDKKFPRTRSLRMHMMIHMGDKQQVCHICEARFVQKSSLDYHMVKHHPEHD